MEGRGGRYPALLDESAPACGASRRRQRSRGGSRRHDERARLGRGGGGRERRPALGGRSGGRLAEAAVDLGGHRRIRSTSVRTTSVSSVFWRRSLSTVSVSVVFCSSMANITSDCFSHLLLALLVDAMQLLPVLGVGEADHLVAVGLAGLSEQDQRRGVGGLQREGEVEENERDRRRTGSSRRR